MSSNVVPMPGVFQMPEQYRAAYHRPAMSGADLRAFRKELGYTQYALARLIGVSEQSFARWEKGKIGTPKTVQIIVWLLVNEARDLAQGTEAGTAETACGLRAEHDGPVGNADAPV